jgi:fumarylacetoacetate (FAA) hydrolase family protein
MINHPVLPQKSGGKLKALVEQVNELQEQLLKLQIDMNKEINKRVEEEVAKSFGDKIDMIDASLRESILQKEVLIDKGLMTREEINAKYADMREKARG